MSNKDFIVKLSSYFTKIIEGEKSLEMLRQILSRKQGFELYSTFRRIIKNNQETKALNISDIELFLQEKNINYNDFSISQLFYKYDTDGDNTLCFEE